MNVRMILPFSLIILMMDSGVFLEKWDVIYETESICALKGSTVNISCSYKHPQEYKLNNTFWIKCEEQNIEIKSLKEYPEYKDRVEYIEDRQKQTSVLRLYNITEHDQRAYCFRVLTDTAGEKWIGQKGIQLNVSALQVKAPQLVLEKEAVNLTCETTCSLTDGFIWYKNGQALNIQSQTLQLQSELSDSGRYSCAVRGHPHLPSPALNISVMYPPRSVRVSISPSAEIVEGDSVTLSCSSDSNPPALFKSIKGAWNFMYIIGLCATITVAAGFGLLFLIITIIIIVHKRKNIKNNGSQDTDNHLNGSQDIEPKKTSAGNSSESGEDDKILYASVQSHKKNKDTERPEEDEVQYASVTLNQPATEAKSTAGQEDDFSVIYSSIKRST